jgi:hypothetical protein
MFAAFPKAPASSALIIDALLFAKRPAERAVDDKAVDPVTWGILDIAKSVVFSKNSFNNHDFCVEKFPTIELTKSE